MVAANRTTFSRRSVWISGYERSSWTSLMWASPSFAETSRNLPSSDRHRRRPAFVEARLRGRTLDDPHDDRVLDQSDVVQNGPRAAGRSGVRHETAFGATPRPAERCFAPLGPIRFRRAILLDGG